VRVPDGRAIALEEYGDPAGPVVLYFHGWPASRLEAGLIPDLPVRMLSLDRPGYGRSSPMPGRTLLDWAADVDYVTTRLGIAQFHVVGLSGGGPYAAACAYALPGRVLSLSLVSPVPPPELVSPRDPGIGLLFRLGRHPRMAHRLFAMARPLLRRRLITPRTLVGKSLPAADRDVLTRPMLAGLGRAWREGFRRGVHGALSDAQIYARPWGFDLAEISASTSLWIGGQDSLIPERALAPYAAIPGVKWIRLADEGHYSLAIRHANAIVAELTDRFPLSASRSVGALPDGITFYRAP
jgi:pimeloyl-ACP methyl ester carboxylesterase